MRFLVFLLLCFLAAMVTGFVQVESFPLLLLSAAIPWMLVLTCIPILVWVERKGSAWIQDRTGPERAFVPGLGIRLGGMVHAIADMLKLATKEEPIPRHVNKAVFVLAPVIAVFIALIVGAVIPYTHPMEFENGTTFTVQALDLNIGILWVLAASSIGVYAVVLAGWASNNKYSQLGGLRASAQMISYEVTLGLAIAGIFLVYESAKLNDIVIAQGGSWLGIIPRWGIFTQPIGFVLFFVAALAETNRTPFDLAEADSELVAGFHTEYGGFKFALFFMAEYVAIMVQCLLISTLFLGGWQLVPWLNTHAFLSQPDNAALVLQIILGLVFVGGLLIGWRLYKWHGVNKQRWDDERAREGAILSVLFGFGPAGAAALAFLIWGGSLTQNSTAITAGVIEMVTLVTKALLVAWVVVWIRWTVPRFRYDQLMGLGWKILLPLGMANLMLTALLIQLGVL